MMEGVENEAPVAGCSRGQEKDEVFDVVVATKKIFLQVPQRRGHRDKITAVALTILLLVIIGYRGSFVDSFPVRWTDISPSLFPFVIEFVSTVVFAQFVTEMLRRLCLSCEEVSHVRTRYDNIPNRAFVAAFQFDRMICVYLTITTVFLGLCTLWNRTDEKRLLRYEFVFLTYVMTQLIWHAVGYKVPFKCDNEMNFGKAFAWQYYYGYLNIILPDLERRMQSYETRENLQLAARRLFLLVPESCYLQPTLDLQKTDVNIIELCKEMDPVSKDHCGSKGRIYRNHVYQIWNNKNEPIHVVMEGITMLINLYVMNLNDKTGLTDEMLRKQTHLFCRALRDILNNCPYSNLAELVFYKDDDERGNEVKISDVILEKLKELNGRN